MKSFFIELASVNMIFNSKHASRGYTNRLTNLGKNA